MSLAPSPGHESPHLRTLNVELVIVTLVSRIRALSFGILRSETFQLFEYLSFTLFLFRLELNEISLLFVNQCDCFLQLNVFLLAFLATSCLNIR
jgi:hypothetical protein